MGQAMRTQATEGCSTTTAEVVVEVARLEALPCHCMTLSMRIGKVG